jgi:acyl-CoA thioesterase FadM
MQKKGYYFLNVHHQGNWDDTSPSGTLNLTGLNIMLQRAAVDHAEKLGFGYQVMSKLNLSWVLVRMNIEILRLPKWREKVILTTWPSNLTTISAFRDYTMINEKTGELLCNASSE